MNTDNNVPQKEMNQVSQPILTVLTDYGITTLNSGTDDIKENYSFAYLQSEEGQVEEFARAAYTKKYPFNLLVSLDIQ